MVSPQHLFRIVSPILVGDPVFTHNFSGHGQTSLIGFVYSGPMAETDIIPLPSVSALTPVLSEKTVVSAKFID